MSSYTLDPNSMSSIPFVGKTNSPCEDIGVGLLKDSSSMVTFVIPPLNFPSDFVEVNMFTSSTMQSPYPWIVPLESDLSSYGSEMPLSPFELAYQVVQLFSDPTSKNIDRMDTINEDYSPLPWLELVSSSDPFNHIFSTDEIIMEVMTLDEIPWNNHHHRSSFLPCLVKSRMIFRIGFHLR